MLWRASDNKPQWAIFVLLITFCCCILNGINAGPVVVPRAGQRDISLGPCVWVGDRKCPDSDIKFYLFTKKNPNDRQLIIAGDSWENSNLSTSNFNPDMPTKVILHGFNSDMYLTSLIDMKDEYLQIGCYNLFYIDYSDLARGPCYIQAVHNIRHVGKCLGNLLNLIYETGAKDIHLIGFSLGAQLANFASIAIRPRKIPRITGLDPAMPLFLSVSNDDKLDATDAQFVDVYHTNAFVQGKVEQCGHVDFYFNGGIIQPGCTTWKDNPVGCSHNRAPMYYMESIRSHSGFWGWPCNSYIMYLIRMCPANPNNLILGGEFVRTNSRGMHFIKTRSEEPFALGRDINRNMIRLNNNDFMIPVKRRDPLSEELDQWGKLDGAFNNIDQFPTPLPQDPSDDDWEYFGALGPNQITQQNNYYYSSHSNHEDGYDDQILPPDVDAPYGVEVLDVLHRKQTTRKRPSHRVKTKTRNSTRNDDSHLIQKLWEDYNIGERRPSNRRSSVPSWRRRQAMRGAGHGEKFFSLPVVVESEEESNSEEGAIDERILVARKNRKED